MPRKPENTDRLKPRTGLPPEVKLIWGELVGAMSPDHFRPSDHAVSPKGLVIDAVLELNGEWQAKQTISGVDDPNSGGNVVFLSPGVRVASNRWSGFATVGLPIVNDLNGLQSEPTYRLFGGVLVGF